jgi:hypothetical protein
MSGEGAHIPLGPSAFENGIVVLRSAMDFGFVSPIDIDPIQFHPDLQSTAIVVKSASDAGARGFVEILQHLIETTSAGPEQDLARSKLAEYG